MGFWNFLMFLYFSLIVILIILSFFQDENDCPASSCSKRGLKIQFPFRIEDDQPLTCGYPGFNLKCSDHHGPPFLTIPGSGDFLVRDINYLTQQIQLYDSNNCLPGRFLNSDQLSSSLSSPFSPFKALRYQNYTFLSCSREVVRPRFSVIECLSNSTNSIVATSSVNIVSIMNMMKQSRCSVYATSVVPVSRVVEYEVDGFSSDLSGDLLLKWVVPDCRSCVAKGRVCGLRSLYNEEVDCYDPNGGLVGNISYWIVVIVFYVPNGLAALIAIIIFLNYIKNVIKRRIEGLFIRRRTARSVAPAPLDDDLSDMSSSDDDLGDSTNAHISSPTEETPSPYPTAEANSELVYAI